MTRPLFCLLSVRYGSFPNFFTQTSSFRLWFDFTHYGHYSCFCLDMVSQNLVYPSLDGSDSFCIFRDLSQRVQLGLLYFFYMIVPLPLLYLPFLWVGVPTVFISCPKMTTSHWRLKILTTSNPYPLFLPFHLTPIKNLPWYMVHFPKPEL